MNSSSPQRGRDIKRKVLALLAEQDFHSALDELLRLPEERVVSPLFSALYSPDETLKWRAVMALGTVVRRLAERDMEAARVVIRRLMWSLNEESGGIGWGAPEAMGEILASHEGLAQEFASMLFSYLRADGNLLDYLPLQRGALWAVGRLAESRPELLPNGRAGPILLSLLSSTDSTVRGLAVRALGFLALPEAESPLLDLLSDSDELRLPDGDGEVQAVSVGDLAQEALRRIRARKGKDVPALPS